MARTSPPQSRPRRIAEPTSRQLDSQRLVETPRVKELTRAQVASLVPEVAAAPTPQVAMTLSARKPFTQRGYIDGLWVGRWDCSSDTIYLTPIVVTAPGVWEGSVIYGHFKAPATKKYLLVAHFYGADITLRMAGPFGAVTAHSSQNQPAVATAQYQLSQGEQTWFNINCTGLYLGFLQKIEMLRLV